MIHHSSGLRTHIDNRIWLSGYLQYEKLKDLNVTVVCCLGITGEKTLGFDYSQRINHELGSW